MSETHFVWEKGSHFSLSPHFNSKEFECPCLFSSCTAQLINKQLITNIEQCRIEVGKSLRITSGYRCEKYQQELKLRGYETSNNISQHQLGNAIDVQPGGTVAIGFPSGMVELKRALEKRFKAIGEGKTFFHVDTRADKERRWSYIKR